MASVLLLTACGAEDGTAAALADQGFAGCAESEGVDTSVADDLTPEEQLDFWAQPGALLCAVRELDGRALSEALAGGFQDPDDAEDVSRSAQGQQAAVRRLALDAVQYAGEPDDAYRAVAELLEAGWWEEDGADTLLLREIASLAVVEGTEGLPGYAERVARSGEDSPSTYTYYLDDVRGSEPRSVADAVREGPQRINDFR